MNKIQNTNCDDRSGFDVRADLVKVEKPECPEKILVVRLKSAIYHPTCEAQGI